MCDCPQDRDDDAVGNQAELFGKCNKGPGDSTDTDDWKTILVLKPPFDNENVKTVGESLKPPSSECSSESTREYKFVDPREFEIDTEFPCGEEESPEYSPTKCRPCLIGEEVEEEEEQVEPDVECTLAIIKPEAMSCRDEIEDRIIEEGFEVYQTRWLQLTPEQTSDFYADCYGRTNFALLVAYMSSAPVIAMVLAKHRAIEDWRHVIGPTKVTEARLYFPDSIRARFGRRGEDFENAVHGSANREQAEREIRFFFPGITLEPLLKGELATDYLWEVINDVLLEGLTLCCKRKPADPILWLANWLIINNPKKPKFPEDLAMIPT